MKKVLIISYWFPPDNLPGSYRAGKFVKYLSMFGWSPLVLTAKKDSTGSRPLDFTLLDDIAPQGISVLRTVSFEPLRIITKLISHFKSYRKHQRLSVFEVNQSHGAKYSNPTLLKRLYGAVVERPLSTPDPFVGWVPFAVSAGHRLILRQKPSVIVSSSPPLSSHLVAYALKTLHGLPWVADFRDVWPSFFAMQTTDPKRIADYVGIKILEKADIVVGISEEMSRELALLCPHLPKKKFRVITNGFDSDDYKDAHPFDFGKFTILHTGEVFARDPSVIIAACEELISGGLVGDDFQIVFQGTMFKDFARGHLTTSGYLKVFDPVPHKEAISCMLGADVLLLLVGSGRDHGIGYPLKFFEYMFSNKPILAISPAGPVSDLIKTARLGFSYEFGQKDLVRERILELYLHWKKGTLRNNRDEEIVRGFDRKLLTQRLVAILGELAT